MWLDATRVTTAPGKALSRYTSSPVATTAKHRDVGTPSACIASLIMYSLIAGPIAHFPSPRLENRVGPEPLSWISCRIPSMSMISPIK